MYWDADGLYEIPAYIKRPLETGLEEVNAGQKSRDAVVQILVEKQMETGEASSGIVWALGAQRGSLNVAENFLNLLDVTSDLGFASGVIPGVEGQKAKSKQRIQSDVKALVDATSGAVQRIPETASDAFYGILDPNNHAGQEWFVEKGKSVVEFFGKFASGDVEATYQVAQTTTQLGI